MSTTNVTDRQMMDRVGYALRLACALDRLVEMHRAIGDGDPYVSEWYGDGGPASDHYEATAVIEWLKDKAR